MIYYKQCVLTRQCGDQRETQVAWIPEALAKPDRSVIVKKDGTEWRITRVYVHRVTGQHLQDHERDFVHQRKASDI